VDENKLLTLPPYKEVSINASEIKPGEGSEVKIYKVVNKTPVQLTDTSIISSLFLDRPKDNIYQITWDYRTNGHGQFYYPNKPMFSPHMPLTCVFSLDADGKGDNEYTKNAVRICGSLTIKDPNPDNKYQVLCQKQDKSPWARKLVPYTQLKNQTQYFISWNFKDEAGKKTTINVQPNEFKMINMETGVVRSTEYIVLSIGLSVFAIAAVGTAGLFYAPAAITAAAADTAAPAAADAVYGQATFSSDPFAFEHWT
jgi:hypothetical protein